MGEFTKNLGARVHRGFDKGYCTICGEYGELTKDHVPPQACNNKHNTIVKLFTGSESKTIFQNGTSFKVLCKICNSERLGLKYDPELIYLSNEITNSLLLLNNNINNKSIILSEKWLFLKPQKIARAIIGHVLAAISSSDKEKSQLNEARNGLHSYPFADALRKYFLDETAILPENINIYFWVYPSRTQVLIKNLNVSNGFLRGNEKVFSGHLIKFFPLAFFIAEIEPKNYFENVQKLLPNKNIGINESVEMKIKLTPLPALNFPEIYDNEDDDRIMIFIKNYAYYAKPKK